MKLNPNYCVAVLIFSLLTACSQNSNSPISEPKEDANYHIEAFEELSSLDGKYQITSRDSDAYVEYDLFANSSALAETWYFPTEKGILKEKTVFFLDNTLLRATHYCASGIQSNMLLVPNGSKHKFLFEAESTHNRPSQNTAYNSGFEYKISGDIIQRDEFWTENGIVTPSSLTLTSRD